MMNSFKLNSEMISSEQKELADYVKQVHLSLRRKSRLIGAEKAWEEHLKNQDVLCKYANCMKKLGEKFWLVNNQTQTDTLLCRIEWVVIYITNYFHKGLLKIEYEKELRKMEIFYGKGLIARDNFSCYENHNFVFQSRLKLLDVGSCYNPFKKYDFLEIYPIDICPADSEVKICNFLETRIVNLEKEWFHDNLTEIPHSFFDVVVFSLFLEYLPSPKQRYISCVNAYKCLKTDGLLLILTPDSKHATANAGIMKRWKMAAAVIGFVRTKLEKLKYLYCMAFRKSVCQKYPILLYNIKIDENNPEEMFVIPQDSVCYKSEEQSFEKSEEEETKLKELFEELPCLGDCRMLNNVAAV